ncbi:non-catalytic module family expn protein [Moniliophthora roreri MCA 2997]|uniref:Non-catalytic module family expn protein n=1 Tax=Moniliophthora roreri (strain MCA 2997) TaxID=1381753 RepID=V2XSJ4_MONRO|nr:non-catalytic module family expn protein [Moniliophthora roreri MCA 2997]KAI3616196.1 non-catalytic module family expn protein [Moniliophthora roreri]
MFSVLTLLTTLFASYFFPLAVASPVPAPLKTNSTEATALTHTGRGTWFNVGEGNCGGWDTNDHHIVAIGKHLYDQNHGSNCGQWVTITNTKNNKVAHGLVRDSCPSCSDDDLDMSPSLFQLLGSLDEGVLPIAWHFEAKGWSP